MAVMAVMAVMAMVLQRRVVLGEEGRGKGRWGDDGWAARVFPHLISSSSFVSLVCVSM
jgi:hypothetical protein